MESHYMTAIDETAKQSWTESSAFLSSSGKGMGRKIVCVWFQLDIKDVSFPHEMITHRIEGERDSWKYI
jgi:hypothetical protein